MKVNFPSSSSLTIMAISYSELQKGVRIIINGQPFEVKEASLMFKGRGHSTIRAKLKNLVSGEMIQKTFHPSDSFKEANLEKIKIKFIYSHRGKFIFCEEKNPSKRFELEENKLGTAAKFLKPNQIVEGIVFNGKIINISLPIKLQLRVNQSPPGIRGDRAQGGTKLATLESGAEINVPLFIKEGDIVEVNTETGEYVRRIEKK